MSKDKSGDQNFVILRGTLARDPMFFDGEHPRCKFTLKTVETYQEKERTSYVPCIAWREAAHEIAGLGKGSRVEVKGGINERSYEQDGVKKWSTEVTANKVEVLWRSEPEPEEDKQDRGPAPHGTDEPPF